uniref:Uncharacterized protein n=1 Tax=viral metagenome TaxID=1070528 RepID=A0A6C0C788_9ZZZZ
MESVFYGEIFDYNMIQFLAPLDMYHLVRTCKSFKRIKQLFFKQRIIELIYQRLHQTFGDSFDDFWNLLCKHNAKITGAFVDAIVLGLETNKITVLCPQYHNTIFEDENFFRIRQSSQGIHEDFLRFCSSNPKYDNLLINFGYGDGCINVKVGGIKIHIVCRVTDEVYTFDCIQNTLNVSLNNIFNKRIIMNDTKWKLSHTFRAHNYELMRIHKEYLRLGFRFYSDTNKRLTLRELVEITEETIIKITPLKNNYAVTSRLYNYADNKQKTNILYSDVFDNFEQLKYADGYIYGYYDNQNYHMACLYECDRFLPNETYVIGCYESYCCFSYLYPNLNHLHGEDNILFIDETDEIFFD